MTNKCTVYCLYNHLVRIKSDSIARGEENFYRHKDTSKGQKTMEKMSPGRKRDNPSLALEKA